MLRRLPKEVSFIENGDRWQDSRLRLPKTGDLVVVESGAIPTFRSGGADSKFHKWADIWYENGTYFLVLEIVPFANISPKDKGSMWRILNGSKDELLNVGFLRWKLVT